MVASGAVERRESTMVGGGVEPKFLVPKPIHFQLPIFMGQLGAFLHVKAVCQGNILDPF